MDVDLLKEKTGYVGESKNIRKMSLPYDSHILWHLTEENFFLWTFKKLLWRRETKSIGDITLDVYYKASLPESVGEFGFW